VSDHSISRHRLLGRASRMPFDRSGSRQARSLQCDALRSTSDARVSCPAGIDRRAWRRRWRRRRGFRVLNTIVGPTLYLGYGHRSPSADESGGAPVGEPPGLFATITDAPPSVSATRATMINHRNIVRSHGVVPSLGDVVPRAWPRSCRRPERRARPVSRQGPRAQSPVTFVNHATNRTHCDLDDDRESSRELVAGYCVQAVSRPSGCDVTHDTRVRLRG